MKIGDEIYIHGYIDEIRSDVVIIRNDGGYFGTVPSEVNCSEKPNSCDTCRNKGVEGCEQPCLGCGCCGLYEVMTENDKLKEKVVEFIKTCARCKHRPIGAMMCEESCHYEPKTEPYFSNPTEEEMESVNDYIRSISKPTGVNIFDFMDEPQTERSE